MGGYASFDPKAPTRAVCDEHAAGMSTIQGAGNAEKCENTEQECALGRAGGWRREPAKCKVTPVILHGVVSPDAKHPTAHSKPADRGGFILRRPKIRRELRQGCTYLKRVKKRKQRTTIDLQSI